MIERKKETVNRDMILQEYSDFPEKIRSVTIRISELRNELEALKEYEQRVESEMEFLKRALGDKSGEDSELSHNEAIQSAHELGVEVEKEKILLRNVLKKLEKEWRELEYLDKKETELIHEHADDKEIQN